MKAGASIFTATFLASGVVCAQQHDEKERAQLAHALKRAKVTLEQALLAGEREGKPISAKFDLGNGRIELRVYAAKGEQFAQIEVDPQTGKIAKVEEIQGGGDLAEVRTQSEAFAQAKLSVRAATHKAVKANPGSRAVSVAPRARAGRPVAEVTLLQGNRFKTITLPLD